MIKIPFLGRKKTTEKALQASRTRLRDHLKNLFRDQRPLDTETLEELEEILLASDLGWRLTEKTLLALKERYGNDIVKNQEELGTRLMSCLIKIMKNTQSFPVRNEEGLTVTLVVGVNGSGKTTSIAKLAAALKNEGRSVILAAGDTFRAAATEQLVTWASRLDVDIVHHQEGADPSAVVFDALNAALARGSDDLIIDTAGRLHTDKNLMKELEKIRRIIQKQIPEAPHETLLVLDATAGQNALSQAKLFSEKIPLTGLVLAKLDGTARGGIVFAIAEEVGVPVKYIGTGEQSENLEYFQLDTFVEALIA
jgi:fused signal recognition particle receptor